MPENRFPGKFLPRVVVVAIVAGIALSAYPITAAAQNPGPPEPKFKVGSVAPDFTLKDQNGKDVSLHDFHGKKSVALAFFVFAFTGG